MLIPNRVMYYLRVVLKPKDYVTFCGFRGLPISVYRVINTFWACRVLHRSSSVLFVHAELIGSLLCFFISFELISSYYSYLLLDVFIGLFQYIRILAHSILPFIICILFLMTPHYVEDLY